jgi:hypothetical protein
MPGTVLITGAAGRPSGTLARCARDHAAVFGDLVVR